MGFEVRTKLATISLTILYFDRLVKWRTANPGMLFTDRT